MNYKEKESLQNEIWEKRKWSNMQEWEKRKWRNRAKTFKPNLKLTQKTLKGKIAHIIHAHWAFYENGDNCLYTDKAAKMIVELLTNNPE